MFLFWLRRAFVAEEVFMESESLQSQEKLNAGASVTLQRNATDRGGDCKVARRSVNDAGGLCRCVRREHGRPEEERQRCGRSYRGCRRRLLYTPATFVGGLQPGGWAWSCAERWAFMGKVGSRGHCSSCKRVKRYVSDRDRLSEHATVLFGQQATARSGCE